MTQAGYRASWQILFGLVLILTAVADGRADDPPSREGIEFFETKIRPLLVKHCYSCHSAEAKQLRGDFRLDSREGLLKGGPSGPAIVPGKPDESRLLVAVRYQDEALLMPPKGKLSDAEIADLTTWIKLGAPDPRTVSASPARRTDLARGKDGWSFRPVQDPPIPAVRDASWALDPIDHFILARLEEKGLRPARPADKRTLIRRATYDLTGLPPTPEDVDAFLADDSPGAFERVVDRLLASPAYGERWGRHWLDVVRYADTAGDNSDYPIPQMYRYRNWVIDAFNRDLPYDRFVQEQLAGDLIGDEPGRYDRLIATGYLANARRFGSYEDARYPWYLTIEDTIDNLGRTFLGLTINCCRCHDHKFDPLTSADYYALYGFFSSTRYPWPGIELDQAQRDLVPLLPPDEAARLMKMREEELARFDARIKQIQEDKRVADKALAEAEKAPEAERKARIAEANRRIEKLTSALRAARKQREEWAKKPLPCETAYAVAEGKTGGNKKVGNACVHIKGDPERLGPEVPRRFPTILGGQLLPSHVTGSGRLELARWITDPANPLTARVMVNRLWHYHFGKGLVPTPSDFGKQGQPPTHPELLDYLARRFIESGWSIKAMHRRMMLSRTYQLSTEADEAGDAIDVANDYLRHFRRRRLDAESIRDTLLAVSGSLDRSPGGAHPFPDPLTWDFTQHKPFKAVYDTNRRSVYLMTQRIQRHPFLALFDGPDTNASTARRITSTTPLQALYLMNDPFVHEQAQKFAARLLAERADNASRLDRAYLLLFGRPPSPEERALAEGYLAQLAGRNPAEAWESLLRGFFLTNEFVYLN